MSFETLLKVNNFLVVGHVFDAKSNNSTRGSTQGVKQTEITSPLNRSSLGYIF